MPEIEVRPIANNDINILVGFDPGYQTTRVWQLERSSRENELQVGFREMRLPRPVSINYPYTMEELISRTKLYDGILVACIDSEPVAYAAMKKNVMPNTAWITELVVNPAFRRKSIATALLLAAQDWASHFGLRKITLEMQSKNHPAISLALKLGYDFSGYNDQYYPNQDIALFFVRSSR